jgi:hypothetical protein
VDDRCSIPGTVMSGSDPCGTHNADKDRGPSGPRRHRLELVRWSETQMSERTPKQTSKRSWMARVWIVMRTRMEVQTGSEGTGSKSGIGCQGFGLVDTRIMWMRMEVQTGSEGAGSDL